MKRALVCGAGGFIGHHLVRRLKKEGYYVVGMDEKYPEFCENGTNEYHLTDLADPEEVGYLVNVVGEGFDEVYQLAAVMGGAGYIFTGDHDAKVMHDSALINLNVLEACRQNKVGKVFFSSSACVYNTDLQQTITATPLSEDMAYPALPDHEYGWEKLFSERLYQSYARNYGMNVRIARFHNIFGPECSWNDGREKVIAALCRKVASEQVPVEVWGDGKQTRSFLYIDECIEGIRRLMQSDYNKPVNIGSAVSRTIHDLLSDISEYHDWMDGAGVEYIKDAPTGVMSRVSDNTLCLRVLKWQPNEDTFYAGLKATYSWIAEQVRRQKNVT